MKTFRLTVLVLLSAGGLLLTLSACGSSSRGYSVNVVRYPDFWATPDAYHTLGVASTVNDIDPGRYVKTTNKQILQELKTNGTYQVTDLTSIEKTDEAIASVAGQVELVLVPTIISVDEDDTERKETDSEGRTYTMLYRFGSVEMQASLYDPNTKDEIVSKVYKNSCDSIADWDDKGSLQSLAKLKECAVRRVTDQMVSDIVVMNQSIYFSQSILLSKDGGKEATKFKVTDSIYVTLNLPSNAAFNSFTFAIQDQEKSSTILSEEFTWTPEGGIGYSYSAKELFEKSGGIEKYKAVILSNGNLAYMQEFKIEKPD